MRKIFSYNFATLILNFFNNSSRFNITMNPANNLASLSTCTTCVFSEDFSNYWTAVLFFRHSNGTMKRVRALYEWQLPIVDTIDTRSLKCLINLSEIPMAEWPSIISKLAIVKLPHSSRYVLFFCLPFFRWIFSLGIPHASWRCHGSLFDQWIRWQLTHFQMLRCQFWREYSSTRWRTRHYRLP